MKKFFKWAGIVLATLVIIYFIGPRPDKATLSPTLPDLITDVVQLEKDIKETESQFELKPDNEARIVWADTAKKQKTKYSIVYVHGFGASWAEGDPIHKQLAKKYGCNLYLARLYDSGVKSPDAFKNLTPENFLAGAKYAISVGKALGDSVIVIGCSAGGLLGAYIAAEHPEIKALILYSPCFKVNGLALATGPWGKQLLQQIGGSHRDITHYAPDRANYWLTRYHTNGVLALQQTMDAIVKPETFAKIKMPVLMLYYYKDEENQDKVVSVAEMLKAYDELGTPASQKRKAALPNAGEHVIASHFTSKDLEGVFRETDKFLSEVVLKQ
ncbi:alpha/beta hydrolase [Runella sp.]|uniref:alpha/beta hydrolase n=1 Tax=Runella sp. TaxID=1960881 RepID=UPI003D0BA0F2